MPLNQRFSRRAGSATAMRQLCASVSSGYPLPYQPVTGEYDRTP
ncbi:hypothetical protein CLJ1_0868 [Pseudomonas paraeruginosa]|nr:hypothetical protein CLJ1_0868 [Pseudomonas aeruginosa]